MQRTAAAALLVGAIFLASCSSGSSGGGGGVAASGTLVGPEGGTVTLANGITIDVPAGAVAAPVMISARSGTDIDPARIQPGGMVLSGQPFQLEPAGLAFAKPVEVTIPYALAAGVKPKDMMGAHRDDSAGNVDLVAPASETTGSVRLSLMHFSTVQAVRSTAPPPVVTKVEPAVVRAGTTGNTVTIKGSNFRNGPGLQVFFGAIATVSSAGVAANDSGTATSVTFVSPTELRAVVPRQNAAVFDVTVKNGDGPTGTLANGFQYVDAPAITSVSPNAASAGATTTVSISGKGFYGTPSVKVGGLDATNVVVLSQTLLTCTFPDDVAGPKTVTVTLASGDTATASGAFRRSSVVSSVSPNNGPVAGGTSVTVSGAGFSSDSTVTIGGAALTGATVVNATTITGTTAAVATAMLANVTVSNGGGPVTLASAFHAGVTVSSVTPRGGPVSGGNAITIRGTGFVPGTTFTLGGAPVTGSVVNLTTFTGTAPVGSRGYAATVATNANGTGWLERGYWYGSPDVLGIVTANGPASFASGVLIRGDGFLDGLTASIGGNALTDVVVLDERTISAVTSGGAVGPTDVVVTTNGGTGTLVGGYEYVATTGSSWRQANTGFSGAYVLSIAFAGSSTGTLYAATGGGVFKTTNRAETWFEVSSGLPSPLVYDVAVDPTDANVVFAAVGSDGVYKTVNGGATWVPAKSGLTSLVQRIAIDPSNTNRLYAATGQQSIMKSVDGGATWTSAGSGLPTSMHRVVVAPSRPTTVYAASNSNAEGVYRSVDAGVTWTKLPSGPSANYAENLAVDPTNADVLWVANGGGLAKTEDGGTTWTAFGTPSGGYRAIAFDPNDSNVVYVSQDAGVGTPTRVLRTPDRGATWGVAGTGLDPTIDGLVVDPLRTSTIYASATGGHGVYRTEDSALRWTEQGLGLTNVGARVAVAPSRPATLYAGTLGLGMFRSLNGGLTWVPRNSGLPKFGNAFAVTVHPTDPDVAYAILDGKLYKTVNGGASWAPSSSGIASDRYVNCLAMKPGDPNVLLAGTSSNHGTCIWKTTDGGASWAPSSSGIDIALNAAGGPSAYSIAFDARSGRVYARIDTGLHSSTDGGATWTMVAPSRGNLETSLAVDPLVADALYVTTGDGVFSSPDAGVTLQKINGNAPFGYQPGFYWDGAVSVDPTSSATLYVVTSQSTSRIWKTKDGGATWVELDPAAVGSTIARYGLLTIDPTDPQTLYLGGPAGGVLKSTTGGE